MMPDKLRSRLEISKVVMYSLKSINLLAKRCALIVLEAAEILKKKQHNPNRARRCFKVGMNAVKHKK